uniref:Uncharacterized protein n=1 Tax=Anguilla anguilla TaxID=7936 RepID=A0A0E9RVU2_ANGAN
MVKLRRSYPLSTTHKMSALILPAYIGNKGILGLWRYLYQVCL